MLQLLHIENIAVIERADIELEGGLTVLSGETGAGKSIVIDSIGAILGRRVSRDLVRSGAKKGFVMFASSVANILGGEMNIHRGYMKRLGITEEDAERVKPSLPNSSYTAYMRAVAAEEGPAEIMAAVLSCALSYEYIAKWIVSNYPNAEKHEFYGEWIQGYASEDYAAENRRLIAYMEKLAEHYTDPQLERLTDIFVDCSLYEGMFWEMAWNGEL